MSKLLVLGTVLVVSLALGQLATAGLSQKSLELLEEMDKLSPDFITAGGTKGILVAMVKRRQPDSLGSLGADIVKACQEARDPAEAKKPLPSRGVCFELKLDRFGDELIDMVGQVKGKATKAALTEFQDHFDGAQMDGKSIEESLDQALDQQLAIEAKYLGAHASEVIATWFVTGCRKYIEFQTTFLSPLLASGLKLADDKSAKLVARTEVCRLVNNFGTKGLQKKLDAKYEQLKDQPKFAQGRKDLKEYRKTSTKGMGFFEKMDLRETDRGLAKKLIKETKTYN